MATNEQRARLVGSRSFYQERDGYGEVVDTRPLSYDTDLNACAELRRYVRERGRQQEFTDALEVHVRPDWPFDLLDATPQQICAAFDATFKDELNAK